MRTHRLPLPLFLVILLGCGEPPGSDAPDGGPGPGGADADPTQPDGAPLPDDILAFLQSIDGMTVTEEDPEIDGYRFFVMRYQQPADHDDPAGGTFEQRLTLLYRDRAAPVVLSTSGYYGSTRAGRGELTRMLNANQISTEQRFFYPSRPEPADWADLTIAQAAADHHRIVTAIRPYFSGAWIATGASKGGMTSIYHRRFYPDDVDAVVAYVAPLSYGLEDARYEAFLAEVGTADCRDNIHAFQRQALLRRESMLARIQSEYVDGAGYTFELFGLEGAFESSVVEAEFAFWQYMDISQCDNLPTSNADSDNEVFQWMDAVASFSYGADLGIEYFQPYYYQAFTQLGYPGISTSHLDDLLEVELDEAALLPAGVDAPFDAAAMPDVADWVATEGSELMFIYGEYDPWTAGKFELGDATDSYVFTVPQGNHGSRIAYLPAGERQQALDVLERWTGVTPVLESARLADEPAGPRLRPRVRLR